MSLPRLICLHGWTMRGAVFDPLAARLSGVEVIAPNLPGHGAPGGGLDACVDLLETLLTTDAPRIVLGWSMGAAIVWKFIERHGSEPLAGLITVDMSPCLQSSPDWPHGLIGQDADRLACTTAEIHDNWPAAAQKIATTMFAEKSGASLMPRDAALAQVLDNDPAVMARYWDEMVAMDLRAATARVDVPWLVAHGGKSRVYPGSTASWLEAQNSNTQRICFAQSGHSPHLEEPDIFAATIARFMQNMA